MPPARSRLTLYVLPRDPDAPAKLARQLLHRLRLENFVDRELPGPRTLVEGGFLRAMSPLAAVGPMFLANNQFGVLCPRTRETIIRLFNPALEEWRRGGPRRLDCSCGEPHDLATLHYRPEAGFASGWLELLDVGSTDLAPDALRIAEEELGGVRIVARRA